MTFFTSGTFWFIEGILATLMFMGFKTWMEDRRTPMAWWKWLLFGLWVFWFGFTIAFIFTSLGEGEPVAAVKGGIIFIIITIVAGVGLWRLLQVGRTKEIKKTKEEPQSAKVEA